MAEAEIRIFSYSDWHMFIYNTKCIRATTLQSFIPWF